MGKLNHVDIRKTGSGNSGSTNALRVLGVKAGLMTFAGDVLKCVLPILLVRQIFSGSDCLPLLAMYTGAGATLGHAAFIFVVAVTRYVSAGSLLVTIIFLAEVICFGQMGGFAMAQPYVYELYLVTFLLMALAWWRHRANIKRLLNGTENKIGFSKK